MSPCRHSFSTRLLYTVVPSELYVSSRTLDTLNKALTLDYLDLYNHGLKAVSIKTVLYKVWMLVLCGL